MFRDTEIEEIKALFARFGFVASPLCDATLNALFSRGLNADEIYSVGCDVYAGFTIEESLAALAN